MRACGEREIVARRLAPSARAPPRAIFLEQLDELLLVLVRERRQRDVVVVRCVVKDEHHFLLLPVLELEGRHEPVVDPLLKVLAFCYEKFVTAYGMCKSLVAVNHWPEIDFSWSALCE